MYVTRPLSLYRRDPSARSLPPPEGPNSGILVIQDQEAQPTCCFGLCNSSRVRDLPFPQNKNLQVRYTQSAGQSHYVEVNRVVFIPALNHPLSANRYYVITRQGKHKGEAYRNSTEEDKTTCCFFCKCIPDLKPEPFKPQAEDMYQQFEISRYKCWLGTSGFVAKSVATDGFPPQFLRRSGWDVHTSTPREFELGEALGVNSKLRARLPDFIFPLSNDGKSVVTLEPTVVGKWYCPFLFIKDSERKVEDQIVHSRFYEMTLEQQWEQIFSCKNDEGSNGFVDVDVEVETEVVRVGGRDVMGQNAGVDHDGVVWFKSRQRDEEMSVGVSSVVVERMKWEEERVGWTSGGSEDGKRSGRARVKKVEEFETVGIKVWKRFGYFVLVERFVLRRMDGSFVMSFEFKHLHQSRTKWE